MGIATVTSKGQLTIPADVRQQFGIEPGHRIVFFQQMDGSLGVSLIKLKKGSGAGILSRYADRTLLDKSDDAIGEAVAEGVAESLERSRPE